MLRKALSLFLLKIFGAGLSFFLYALIGRKLGANGAGIYFFSLSISMIVSTFCRLGADNAILKYIARFKKNDDFERCNGILFTALLVASISSLVVLVVFIFLKPHIQYHFDIVKDNFDIIKIFMFSVVFVSLFTLVSQALFGTENSSYAILIITIIPQFIALLCSSLTINQFGIYGAAYSYLAGTIVSFIVSLGIWRWRVKGSLKWIIKIADINNVSKVAFSLFMASIAQISIQWISPLISALFLSQEEIGALGVAARITALMNFIFIAFNSILAPRFSALFSENNKEEITKLSTNGTVLMIIFSLPVLIGFLLFSSVVMRVFGADFGGFGYMLNILAVGQFLFIIFGGSASLLIMSGHEKIYRNILLFAATIHILFVYFFGINFGAVGVCWGMTAALCLQNMLCAIMVYRVIKIKWLSIDCFYGWIKF